jgi:hypothetical protein
MQLKTLKSLFSYDQSQKLTHNGTVIEVRLLILDTQAESKLWIIYLLSAYILHQLLKPRTYTAASWQPIVACIRV